MAVTKYMAIKWVKAAFEIVIAIVLIVFGNKILFGVFPAEAADKATFQLIVGLLWFLVIMCIIAAVRNIILSLRPEPKESLVTLNEKIDALDKKLVTMGLASETIPEAIPPSPQELKKGRNRKIMVAASIVAAVVVLAAISMVFLIPKMGGGGNPAGGATPEDTLDALITAMNSRDANGVLSLTIYSFGNATEKSQFRQGINEMLSMAGASFHITKNNAQIKNSTDLNASENNDLTSMKNDIQNHISNTITAYCIVVYNMTVTIDNNNSYQDGKMPCFQINNGWYLLPDFGGPGGNGGNNLQDNPQQAFWSFIDRVKARNSPGAVEITVYKFGNISERSEAEKQIGWMWAGSSSFDVNVSGISVHNWSSLNPTEQNNLSNIQANVSTHYGKSVQDSVFVYIQMTITNDSGTYPMSDAWACFKIDNLWYFDMGGGNSGTPQIPSIGFLEGSTGTNWTFTVTSVNLAGGPPLYTNNVYLMVIYANGTEAVNMTLNAMISTGWVNGTRYNDNNMMVQLDTTDMFQLDSSIYFSNSWIILRNFDGTQVYYSKQLV